MPSSLLELAARLKPCPPYFRPRRTTDPRIGHYEPGSYIGRLPRRLVERSDRATRVLRTMATHAIVRRNRGGPRPSALRPEAPRSEPEPALRLAPELRPRALPVDARL